MNIGDFKHRITIKYNSAAGTSNANGVPLETWTLLVTLYAKRIGLKGRLFYQAAAAQAETDIMFTVRYCDGIKAGMRIYAGSEIFEIKVPPVDVDGNRRWLEIHTREIIQNGG